MVPTLCHPKVCPNVVAIWLFTYYFVNDPIRSYILLQLFQKCLKKVFEKVVLKYIDIWGVMSAKTVSTD